jgi:hypothetical protein
MKRIFITLYVAVFAISATVKAAEFAEPARFENAKERGAGWVNFHTSNGQYVYGEMDDAQGKRINASKPFLIGGLERKDYEFFSYQEEEALWLVMQDQIAAMQPKPKRRANSAAAFKSFEWPKVVVRGNEVCVPVLESAQADDWREHLTCTEVPRND